MTVEQNASRRGAWVVLALLVCLMIVNYADKVVVGLTGVEMMKELGLTADQFGTIQSSFFWLYAVGCVLGGWLGGRVPVRWLLAGITSLWALSLAPLAAQVGFTAVVGCRVLLGFAEGPATALAMQVAHSWFPAHRRAVPTSIVAAGASLGPVIAAPVLTWVIAGHSWHAAFAVLAVLGLLLAVLCLAVGREGPEVAPAGDGHGAREAVAVLPERVPLSRLLGNGTVIGMSLLFFVAYACTAVKVSWLPLYLRQGLGYSAGTAGDLVTLPYLMAAVAVVVAGVLSRVMTKRGMSNRITRGVLPAALVLTSAVATVGFPLLDRGAPQIALLTFSACLNSAGYGVAFAGLADIAPAKQRGTLFGIVTAFYSLGGVIAPKVIGKLVTGAPSVLEGYRTGFLVLGVAMAVGGLAAMILVNPERDRARLVKASAQASAHTSTQISV